MSEIDQGRPVLYDYETGEPVRNATKAELAASIDRAEHDGGRGVITVWPTASRATDGRDCYVLA